MESQNKQSTIHNKIRSWLGNRFCPVCAVFASSTVKDILNKQSGLAPSELLRPFGEVGNLNNISIQTSEKNQAFKFKSFRIDFVDSNKIDNKNQ